MANEALESLVADASLVAEVGSRLGKLKTGNLLTALNSSRQALETGVIPQDAVLGLQSALNSAMGDIYPITLNDLKMGWRPYGANNFPGFGVIAFFLFSLLLIGYTAYATRIYERAKSLQATILQLQDARGAEQAIRLYGMLKRNQDEVIESLSSGKKDFLYEVFSKALVDLKLMDSKSEAFLPIASEIQLQLDIFGRAQNALDPKFNYGNPAGIAGISKLILQPNYGPSPISVDDSGAKDANVAADSAASAGIAASGPIAASKARGSAQRKNAVLVFPQPSPKVDVQELIGRYITQLQGFNQKIGVAFNPLLPNDYSLTLFYLSDGMTFIGSWVLPALYGLLGATIFYMRRLLDPATPNPTWMRIVFRIALGGFAGIIVAWFWTPSSQKPPQAEFASLTTFGVAFLVGFSTDIFFQALDRLVGQVSQAVGNNAT